MRLMTPARGSILVVSLLLLVSLAACGDGEGGMFQDVTIDPAKERVKALEGDTDAVLATLDDYFSALDAHDAGKLRDLFTQRAQVYLDDGHGRPAAEFVSELTAQWADWNEHTSRYKLGGATLMRPYGWAMMTGTVSYQLAAGEDIVRDFAATFGVEQQGERWLISHLHLTLVQP
jgi:hypothetical protein